MNIQSAAEDMQNDEALRILLHFLNARGQRRGHPVSGLFDVVLEAL
jgi:hypothetical protein